MNNIDIIYDEVDRLMNQNDWNQLSLRLTIIVDMASDYSLVRKDYSLDELLAWATATLPAKSKIKSRPMFIAKCKELHPDPELWRGLE